MSAGLLDELSIPKAPRLWCCICCKFSFVTSELFVAHLLKMKADIDAQLAKEKK